MSTDQSNADTSRSPIVITHRITGEVLYRSETANTLRGAVVEAVKAGADLGSANLGSADLRSANLRSADLRSANLRSANLGFADLGSADLGFADLRSANLRSADLRSANLGSANLRFADLRSANLVGTTCLSVTGLPSGHAILAPLPDGWRLTVGCWNGTVVELRELIAREEDWPEATGDEIERRRPMLSALADMCDAWIAVNGVALEQVQTKWGSQ